jgi:hypothetical protein
MEEEIERQNKEKMKFDFSIINRRNAELNREAAMLVRLHHLHSHSFFHIRNRRNLQYS